MPPRMILSQYKHLACLSYVQYCTCRQELFTENWELKKPLTMAITVSVTYFSRATSAWLRSVVVLHTCRVNRREEKLTNTSLIFLFPHFFIHIQYVKGSMSEGLYLQIHVKVCHIKCIWTHVEAFNTQSNSALHWPCPPGSCQRASRCGWTCRSPSFPPPCPHSNGSQSSHRPSSPGGQMVYLDHRRPRGFTVR